MFRKSIFAIAAVAAISAATLVPTTADAKGFKGGWGGGWGYRGWGIGAGVLLAAPLAYGYSCYRWVSTPYGYVKTNVCY